MKAPKDMIIEHVDAVKHPDRRLWRYTCLFCGQRQRFVSEESAISSAWHHADVFPCAARCLNSHVPAEPETIAKPHQPSLF